MNVPTEPVSVSLNGVDNVGKTTQLRWLHRAMSSAHLVGSIDRWDSRWSEVAAGDFSRWWFEESTTVEHVRLMMESHRARRRGSGPLALEDRGLPMLYATCAATAVVKDHLAPGEALREVERIAGEFASKDRRELHVLLRRSNNPTDEAASALDREERRPDITYTSYQRALAQILDLQVANGDYDIVMDIGQDPILDVQRTLARSLQGEGVATDPIPDDRIERLWVLGGMSESGKTTTGEVLRDEHGVTRLKIGYLLEVAAVRAGVGDPYVAWDERLQAEMLSEEILRIGHACKTPTISIESAHSYESTAHLKRIWGQRCTVLFIDAHENLRTWRASESRTQLRARDAEKRARGADRVVGVADHALNNNGPLSALKVRLTQLAEYLRGASGSPALWVPSTQRDWLAEASAQLTDEQSCLVLATGTTGTSRWRDGWSDLDLLVVRDSADAAWLRRATASVARADGAKVAISVFTTADIATMRVPPRVLRSLRLAADGIGVLHRRPDYRVPIPDERRADVASRADLGLVLMTLRRLIAASTVDERAIYKHLVLVAKILLHADGHLVDDSEEALELFDRLHPDSGCTPPSIDDLIRHPDHDVDRLIEATDRLLSYMDTLGTPTRGTS